nr:LysE family transporter [Acidaminobacter sp. JC074]
MEIILFSFGIIYAPGPLNILSLNEGLNKKFKSMLGFFVGIGIATFILFLVIGYTGEKIIKPEHMVYISSFGAAYILYLAYKVYSSTVDINEVASVNSLTFKEGFLMQLLNPKATLVTLPIATISFPANDITGIKVVIMSMVLATIAGMAPCSYAFLGERFSSLILNKSVLVVFNKLMALLLVFVALTLLREHVFVAYVS